MPASKGHKVAPVPAPTAANPPLDSPQQRVLPFRSQYARVVSLYRPDLRNPKRLPRFQRQLAQVFHAGISGIVEKSEPVQLSLTVETPVLH